MQTIPGSFSNGWHAKRDARWEQWHRAIQRDRNFSRILFNLPLIPPVRREVLEAARRLGTTTEVCETESLPGQAHTAQAPAPAPLEP